MTVNGILALRVTEVNPKLQHSRVTQGTFEKNLLGLGHLSDQISGL